MRHLNLLVCLIACLSGCRKGYEVCVSNADLMQFDCSYSRGKGEVIAYSESEKMAVYSIHDFQLIADFCADQTLPKPRFTKCAVYIHGEVFHCGLSDVKFSESNGYIGLSEIDNTALMATCNL